MKRALKNGWKRICSVVLAVAMVLTMLPAESQAASSANADGTFNNPVIYADVPDIDMIRVDDAYYMVSTTMHLSPGCPIMKSTDLVNWEIVNYVYDILGDGDAMNLRNGKNMYGNGQWASSLKYHNGIYYVAFNSNTTRKAYLYTTDDIEKGAWTKTELDGFYHDLSLFFDDDGKGYLLYGGGEIKCVELSEDYKSVKKGTEQTLFNVVNENWGDEGIGTSLAAEGTHIIKKDGYYYVFNISWPKGGVRTEICHRSRTFPSTQWENKIILKAKFQNNGVNAGVAQGAVIDTPDGKWYGYLFQDHGAIGRTPVLTDCKWMDGWPMLGKDGDGQTVEAVMPLPAAVGASKSLTKSDEFYNDAEHREFAAKARTAAAKRLYAEEGAGIETVSAGDGDVIELITNGGAETGDTTGWKTTPGESAPKLEAVGTDKKSGNYSIFVSGRKGTGAGACQDISGKMAKGKTYTISGSLKYTTGPDEKNFYVTLQHGANYNYRQNLVKIKAKKGEWVDFSGTYEPHDKSDAYPFDYNNVHIFVENPWVANATQENDYMDYYLDDFSVTVPFDNMAGDGTFNSGAGSWKPFAGQGKVEVVTGGRGGADDKCLKVSGRKANWNGAALEFGKSGNKMTPGNTYNMKAWIKYDAAEPAQQKFSLTMTGKQGDSGETKYHTAASGTIKSGEWTQVTGSWTMPEDANTAEDALWTLYVNTTEAGPTFLDFYLDDVVIEEQVPDEKDVAEPGEHDYNGSDLDLVWQWNHNPNNNNWSLTEREGWLRLKTGSKATSLLNARNTLTQRTFGPACSGSVRMDVSKMKNGDVAGLASLSFKYGYIAVKKEGSSTKLQMVDASANNTESKEDKPVVKASVDCPQNIVYLKEDFNYAGNEDGSGRDTVTFYYSFDGKTWNQLGDAMKMSYELVHFMGSKFAIFNYTTAKAGGYVDVDYFRVSDQITGTQGTESTLNAQMSAPAEVSGAMGSTCSTELKLDELRSGGHTSLKASVSIPDGMSVEDVAFNTEAIKGDAVYTVKGGRLMLEVKGEDVSFAAADKLFATIKLKVNSYASEDKNAEIKADYIRVDNGVLEYDVTECTAFIQLKAIVTKAIAKKLGYGNPIFTQAFGADPYAMEYDGRVYVYMTADAYVYDENGVLEENKYSKINTLRVVSSADLMNWTDHGEIKVAGPDGAAKWAKNSWAPAIAHKTIDGREKFFLYFANGGSGIGVLEGDSPLGPWSDPNGKALLSYGYPECEGVVWCFDPAVLVDDDGTGYIYFGGGVPEGQNLNPKTARVAQLTDDMVQIKDRRAEMINAPCMFEDSGIFKYNGKYYYSYCSNFTPANKDGYPGTGTICYMVSDNPMGPYTYAGEIFSNPSVWFGTPGNNHHATFVFEGESYFTYHAQTVGKEEGEMKGYRSTHIDKIEMRSDGTIKDIKGTYEGIPQLHTMNPYERIDAETIAWNAGVRVAECKEPGKLYEDYNTALTELQDGDWTSVAQLDFGTKGADKFQVSAASKNGGSIEIRLDSPEGTLIGTAQIAATGSEDTYKTVTCDLADDVTGTRNVFLVFKGSETENIMNVDYYQFTEKSGGEGPVVPVPETCTVTLDADGGEVTTTSIEVEKGKKMGSLLPTPEKEGFDFQGWYTAKTGGTAVTADTVINNDMTIYAQWKAVQQPNKPTDQQISSMNAEIAKAKKLLDDLVEAEKEKLQGAITEAENILKKDGLTKDELENALGRLQAAVRTAEEAIEASKLAAAEQLGNKIKDAKELLEKLSESEKAKLQPIIEEAEAVLKKDGATEKEIQEVLDKLKAAVSSAEEIIEAEKKLKDEIAGAEKLLEKLSGAEKEKLQAAIDEAKGIMNTEGVTREQMEEALRKLKESVDEAEETTKLVRKELSNKIVAAKTMLKNLSNERRQKLQAVIDEAEAVLNKDGATEEEMQAVLGKLKTAIQEAEKPDEEPADRAPKKGDTFTAANGLKYKVTAYSSKSKTVTVTGAGKKLTSLMIPDTVKYKDITFKVTAVGSRAFTKQSNLKSAVIGKHVTTIGVKAFYNDKKLAKVTFKGTSVKTIGKDAFKGIKKNAAFRQAKTTFTYKNVKYKIAKCTASAKEVTVTGISKKKLTTLNIPATVKFNGMTFSVTAVNKKAFKNNKTLKSVTIGKNVKMIGSEAFRGAKKLAKIKFSGTAVKTIGKNAFKDIKKNAVFTVKKSKRNYYKKLLNKAKTKNYKLK